jgi:hypothetical protein
MNSPVSDADIAIWRRLVGEHNTYNHNEAAFRAVLDAFLAPGVNRVALVHAAIPRPDRRNFPPTDRFTALSMLPHLTPPELLALFPDLVFLASWGHGAIGRVRDTIGSLPRGWVLEHIEDEAERWLREGTDDEFRRFLELYDDLDAPQLTRRLARRAAAHADPDIRDAGEEFLGYLEHDEDRT